MFAKIKNRLYYYFAEKNWGVRREYGPYVDTHQEEHQKQRWKHWWLLIRLNWHYRVLRRQTPMLGSLKRIAPNSSTKQKPERPRKMPYMNGAESALAKRPSSVHLMMQLLPYDVVSFDIFDTLLLRPFAKPVDLFYIVGKRLNMPEFFRIRIDAERRARELALNEKGSREITIQDIYALIEMRTGLPKDVGVDMEFAVEMQYCRPNPYMKQVFRMLQEQQKTIIIVSDMYLPYDKMTKLLENHGYTGYDRLYVSCDYGCSKHSKGLYKYVLRDYENKTIMHIGDNVNADVKCAEECGLKTVHYRNVHEVGAPYRADGMSELVGSAYTGLINMYLHNGLKQYDVHYEYGFIYGGLYVFGFCNWIYQKAKKEGVEKILFLSRDGAIYQRIFTRFFSDVSSEYFLWSRIANTKYTFKRNRYAAFESAIRGRANSKTPYSIGDMLDAFGLAALKAQLTQFDLREDTLIIPECLQSIERFFSSCWQEIAQVYATEQEHIQTYIQEKIGAAKKVAIIDVGWVGSGPTGLKYLIEQGMQLDCQVYCWQGALVSSPAISMSADALDETVEAYIFSDSHNRLHFDTHIRTNRNLNNVFFEIFTQDCSPSYVGMSAEGDFLFQLPEVENYPCIQKIHQGIEDFCTLFHETFKHDPYLYSVPGYDAYLPFRVAIRSAAFFEKFFGDFAFPQVAGSGNNRELTETIGDVIRRLIR